MQREGEERRKKLLELVSNTVEPLSGSVLAKQLGVSRQVIVQDIALLRAVDKNIISTTKGYLLYQQEMYKARRCFVVKHTTEQIEDELCTMVDLGGRILDVFVEHEIYGTITADLNLKNRRDVMEFVERVQTKKTVPLKELTAGRHMHTVEADTEEILDEIEAELLKKGYLFCGETSTSDENR